MRKNRLFEHRGHWLVQRSDTPHLSIYWCRPGTRRVERRSTGTSDLEEAKRKLIEFVGGAHPVDAVAAAPPSSLVKREVPVLDLLTDYLLSLGRDRPSFVRTRLALAHWLSFLESVNVVYASELTLDVQERYITFRRAGRCTSGVKAANGTLRRELGILRAALRRGWRRGIIASMPFVASVPSPPPRDRFLTSEEAQRLIAACEPGYVRLFVQLALLTLQRPKAIFSLRLEQVDLANNRVNFLPEGAIQTNKRRPMIPISRSLRPLLESAIRDSRSGYIIEKDGLPLKSMRKAFATAVRKAGLPPESTPYVLRHTGATLLAAAGVPMHQIASMLGHTTQHTTEIYAKRRPEFLLEAVGTLDGLFGAQPIEKAINSAACQSAPVRAKVAGVWGRRPPRANGGQPRSRAWRTRADSNCRPLPSEDASRRQEAKE